MVTLLTDKNTLVLLPGEATSPIGTKAGSDDVAARSRWREFTVGFGVEPQLQVQRQIIDKSRSMRVATIRSLIFAFW